MAHLNFCDRNHSFKQLNSVCYSANAGTYTKKYMMKILDKSINLYQKDLLAHYGCVNAVEFSPQGDFLASGGDDRRLLLWKIQSTVDKRPTPFVMKGEHGSNIFCVAFDNNQKTIFSAGNDENIILHDLLSGSTKDVFLHTHAVYSVSVDPMNDNVFASAGDNGTVLIWDIREPPSEDPFCLARHKEAYYSVMFNPVEPRLLVTANNKQGVALWDIRKPKNSCLLRYKDSQAHNAMNVRFNSMGNKILALRRRLLPVLYDINSPDIVCEFDSPGYYNSCTMKSCCFGGYKDEYVLSGSDDFKLYMWKIPSSPSPGAVINEAHMILKGHRSIVNQVRFNPTNFLLASSGVEKIVKLWSVFPTPGCAGSLDEDMKISNSRKFYSPEDYVNIVLNSGIFNTHDYSNHSVHEDSRMMAFFDSLVQRDIEGWTSDTTGSSQDDLNWEVGSSASSNDGDTKLNSDDDCTSENILGALSDSDNSAEVYNSGLGDSEVEREMEISDILTRRIAAKRRDLKFSSKLSYLKRKYKETQRLKAKKSEIMLSPTSSSSEDDDETWMNDLLNSPDRNSIGFLTVDTLFRHPVGGRHTHASETAAPSDNRRKLQRLKRRILMNLFDADSDDEGTARDNFSDKKDDSSEKACSGCDDPKVKNDVDSCKLKDKQKLESNCNETLPQNNSESTDDHGKINNLELSEMLNSSDNQENSNLPETGCKTNCGSGVTDSNTTNLADDTLSMNSTLYSDSQAGPSSGSSNGNVTWAQFKRFKNKMQRASRQYRKYNKSGPDDSD